MISQFYIVSARGDVIIRRDYLGNVPRSSPETFFRSSKFWKEGDEAPPVFMSDGVSYLHVKEGGVEVVATTRENVSPSLVLEFLRRVCSIIRDYCGHLSEETCRKNFVLIYELLDEVLDYGLPQATNTEALKAFVLNEPTVVPPPSGMGRPLFSLTKGPTGVFKSVLDTNRSDSRGGRDEIFVDVVERITCTFNTSGYVSQAQVDGSVQVKSYLAGNPGIKIKLNDDLLIGRRDNPYGGGSLGILGSDPGLVVLDDCQFHEVANLESFDLDHSVSLVPPEGEFALLNYRSSQGLKPPFRLQAVTEADPGSSTKALLTLRLWCDIPADKAASGLEVEVPTPRYVQRVHCELDSREDAKAAANQSWDYSEKTHLLKWKFKRMAGGGSEAVLRARLTLERPFGPFLRSEIGPVNLRFTIPMFAASRLSLKYLQILKRDKSYNPYRWVRYVTSSSSYTFRT
ncbi:Mu homology domain-containing protein [Haematococcus lacustris]